MELVHHEQRPAAFFLQGHRADGPTLATGCLWVSAKTFSRGPSLQSVLRGESPESGPYAVTIDEDAPPRCLHIYLALSDYTIFVDRSELLAHRKRVMGATGEDPMRIDYWSGMEPPPVLVVAKSSIKRLQRGGCAPPAPATP